MRPVLDELQLNLRNPIEISWERGKMNFVESWISVKAKFLS